MQHWINGPATDGIDDNIKMAHILKSSIPARPGWAFISGVRL